MKSGFWKTDWFFGLAVALVVLLLSNSDLLQRLERKAYDLGVSSSSRVPLDRIAVIGIDEVSLANLGPWPWPREILAKTTDILTDAKAKVIATTIPFAEPQTDLGYKYITRLLEIAGVNPPAPSPSSGTAAPAEGVAPATPAGELGQFVALLREAEGALNPDRRIADSFVRARNVLLPMLFTLGEPSKADKPLPPYAAANGIRGLESGQAIPAATARIPIEPIGKTAAGLGHIGTKPDIDGVVRTEPLAVQYLDRFYPSLSMMIAARSLDLGPADIKVLAGEGVGLGKRLIDTDSSLQMHGFFYRGHDGAPAFAVDSFNDVYTGKIDAAKKYRDKIVLIGLTASGAGATLMTPISPSMFPVVALAHSVSSILKEDFFVVPAWGWMVTLAVLVIIAMYQVMLMPRLAVMPAVGISAGLLVVLLGAHFVLMTTKGIWIQLMAPAVLLVVGHVALAIKRSVTMSRAPAKTSAESHRMLGLAYLGQGELDMAWEKFRLVPLSDALMDDLYNLALDFEKKGQSPKAETVYCHMVVHNPAYRDVQTRLSPAKRMSETVILGAGGGSAAKKPVTPATAASGEKQMLGRYQIERELGKGAMGVVYQGKDPKIGRVVAIKTMALAQEFEASELAEVKERFFREAETAGRLAHQNIVTIYDAGEGGELAYIAMELLRGGDLGPYTKPDALLPIDKVISIVARTADALGYAHKQGVVHRDIKPANIMYHPETDSVKVTDFGIARLTDSSKTKTGMVLGTPSFMSPEQLAGQRIDGRSDLFSLAGTFYQLLCGKLPFEGSSMGRLMFNISSAPPPDIKLINPNVSDAVAAFIDRAMEKEPDKRFQTGEEFAAALRLAASDVAVKSAPVPAPAARAVDIQL